MAFHEVRNMSIGLSVNEYDRMNIWVYIERKEDSCRLWDCR